MPTERSRMLKIHWWRVRNVWSVIFSDHCEHYKRLVIRGAPLETVLSDKAPRAFLKGRGRLIRHNGWAEVVK